MEIFSATIILLNGTSSAGKTTIAKALQELSGDNVLFHTGVDHFWKMVPREFYDGFGTKSHETWQFVASTDHDDKPIVQVTAGPLGKKFSHTMAQFIKCLADCGHDVVVDEVLLNNESLHYYAQALREHKVYFVGVICDLVELERREIARGDRMVGLSRGLVDTVHQHENYYDIVIDTTSASGRECALKIWDAMEAIPHPQGLKSYDELFFGQ
jgi:chloramphenicol 3-O phosphotransferase